MSNENGNDNPQNNENLNELLDIKIEELDETALREKLTEIIPKYKETHQSNKQLFERAKTAEGGLKELREKVKALESNPNPANPVVSEKVAPQAKTGELDETQLGYLELNGVSEDEDIKVIEDVMKKTGQTVRLALKDDYVQAKLKVNKDKRDLQNATPGASKRGGVQMENIDAAVEKFKATGELPKDFELRTKIIDTATAKDDLHTPPWRR